MLGTLKSHQKPSWHEYADAMTHAYNCTQHDSTGYTPYFLMFGRHPKLPVDLIFQLPTNRKPCEYSDYVQTLQDGLSHAYAQANQMSRQAKNQQKKYYDRKARHQVFKAGDRVLVKICHVEGRKKLGDRWEAKPYIVVKKQPGIPVYVVRSEDGERERVIHRNLLTQCMFLPLEPVQEENMEDTELETNQEMEDTELETNQEMEDTGQSMEEDQMKGTDEYGAQPNTELETRGQGAGELVSGNNLPQESTAPRRNPPRDRHPPKRLSFECQVPRLESVQEKRERGWQLWQKFKAGGARVHS